MKEQTTKREQITFATAKSEQLSARVERLAHELMQESVREDPRREDRTEVNRLIAERLILRWWTNADGSPGDGYKYFCALLERAVTGPICTPEYAKVLLPVLLEVNDDMDCWEWDEREWARRDALNKKRRDSRAKRSASLRTSKRSRI